MSERVPYNAMAHTAEAWQILMRVRFKLDSPARAYAHRQGWLAGRFRARRIPTVRRGYFREEWLCGFCEAKRERLDEPPSPLPPKPRKQKRRRVG